MKSLRRSPIVLLTNSKYMLDLLNLFYQMMLSVGQGFTLSDMSLKELRLLRQELLVGQPPNPALVERYVLGSLREFKVVCRCTRSLEMT